MLKDNDVLTNGGVYNLYSLGRGIVGDEILVIGSLAVADESGSLKRLSCEGSLTLKADYTVGCGILDNNSCTGLYGKALCRCERTLIADPLLKIARLLHLLLVACGYGSHKSVLVEVRINIELPIYYIKQVIVIAKLLLGTVLPKKLSKRARPYLKAGVPKAFAWVAGKCQANPLPYCSGGKNSGQKKIKSLVTCGRNMAFKAMQHMAIMTRVAFLPTQSVKWPKVSIIT